MGDLGFWALAHEDPDHLALVAPDGTEYTRGRAPGPDQPGRPRLAAARASKPGDVVATLLPNGVEVFELYLAALQAGWYLVPINHHLVAPEVAYILTDSEAKAFVAHERFAEVASSAADEAELPSSRLLRRGRDRSASPPTPMLRDAQPTDDPEDRTIGDVMNYTSGTTGNPKGVLPAAERAVPRGGGARPVGHPLPLRHPTPATTTSTSWARRSTTPRCCASREPPSTCGHTVVLMDKWVPEEMLQLIERYRVTSSHMVPTQFHRLLALPEETRSRYDLSSLRHMIHAAAPCPVDVKYKMIEWWGNAIDEYYAASEGGGTLVTAEEWLEKPGTVGKPWPISEIAIFDDEGNRIEEPNVIGTVYMSMQTGDFEYHKDKEKTKSNRIGKFFTVGDVGLPRRGRLPVPARPQDRHDHLRRGQHLPGRDRERPARPSRRSATRRSSASPTTTGARRSRRSSSRPTASSRSPELAAEILAYCAGRLAKFKTPKSIDFTDAMPRDPNGKLYKRKLRDPYWEGREKI